jgi:hypothetical protein
MRPGSHRCGRRHCADGGMVTVWTRGARPVAQAWDRTVLRFCDCRSGRARPRRIYGVPRFGVTAGPPWEAPDPPPALVSSPAESADTSGWARVQHDQLGQVDGFQPEDHRGAGRLDQLDQAPQAVGTQAVLGRRDQGVTGPNGRHLIYFVCRVISGEAAVVDHEEVAAVESCDFPTVLERWAGLKGHLPPAAGVPGAGPWRRRAGRFGGSRHLTPRYSALSAVRRALAAAVDRHAGVDAEFADELQRLVQESESAGITVHQATQPAWGSQISQVQDVSGSTITITFGPSPGLSLRAASRCCSGSRATRTSRMLSAGLHGDEQPRLGGALSTRRRPVARSAAARTPIMGQCPARCASSAAVA